MQDFFVDIQRLAAHGLLREIFTHVGDRFPGQLGTGFLVQAQDFVEHRRQGRDVARRVQPSGFALDYRLPGAAVVAGDNGAAQGLGLAVTRADSVAAALGRISTAGPPPRVLICGTLYLAGSILASNPQDG